MTLYNVLSILDNSRSQNKSAEVELINKFGLYVQVAYLGPNLESAVDFFER